ncbi:hypothetical protein [Sulfuriroseicoccus oceanibius]|uniref:Uncharacterized protein n=1 Tax=Sulfuriroseicoccus oceanibius TaxID=2707525 RepID=A0A6B3L732_9BACT|nr:hypothetical protein [Sulfuriroseicoccus oceanibius]QQL43867.1 hypothetical protein G3M56_008145 [Sulfuriroseicoccus oceanibius]
MSTQRTLNLLAAAALLIPTAPALANEAAEVAKPTTEATAPAQSEAAVRKDSYTVKKDEFSQRIAINGTLMPAEAYPLMASPKRFTTLRITHIAPHASSIKKGESIVEFDLSSLDDQIESLEKSIELQKLGLKRSKLDLDATTKLTPIAMEETEAALEQAKADFDYLMETTIPIEKEEAKRSVINSKRNLAYSQEELRQLEKMYVEDDLTEETEEIVLKRIKWQVDNGEFNLRRAEIGAKRKLEVEIPRSIQKATQDLKRTTITHEKAKIDFPAALKQKTLEFESAQRSLAQSEEQLAELKADREALTALVAPVDGIVLYGDWSGDSAPPRIGDMIRNQQVGRGLGVHSVFATVVPAGKPGFIDAKLHEGWRSQINWRGGSGDADTSRYAVLAAAPQVGFGINIDSLSPTVGADQHYQLKLAINDGTEAFADDSLPPVNAGMAVTATLVDYSNPEALVVPTSHLKSKFENGRLVRYVVKINEDDTTTDVPVTYHRTANNQVEILSGLEEGDVIAK